MVPNASLLDINFWANLVVDGFIAGALIGAIIGAITWAVTEKGSNIVFILAVSLFLGLVLGVYMEGGDLLRLASGGPEALLESSETIRGAVFASIVGISKWVFAFLALGSAVASLRRSILGALIGGAVGTIFGMILILFRARLAFSTSNPLAIVLIALASMLVLTVIALNQSEN